MVTPAVVDSNTCSYDSAYLQKEQGTSQHNPFQSKILACTHWQKNPRIRYMPIGPWWCALGVVLVCWVCVV